MHVERRAVRRRSRSRSTGPTRSRTRTRLTVVYFVLAAGWGFITGTMAIVIGLALAEQPLEFGPALATLLIAAVVAMLVGALVVALAYRDTSGRWTGE